MGKGSFINRKLAKGPGHAQQKARLAQGSERERKLREIKAAQGIGKRATMKAGGPEGLPGGSRGKQNAKS